MTSFCLIYQPDASTRHSIAQRVLQACRRTICRSAPMRVRLLPVDAADLTVIAIVADDAEMGSLLSFDETETCLIACLGELDQGPQHVTCAEALRAAFDAGGVDALAAVDGCFACVVYERSTGRLVLAPDGVGQRTLRYAIVDGTTIVSPHDMPLVATGLIPVDPDLTTAASIASLGWSVGEASLLKRINTCAPGQIRTIGRRGEVRVEPHPFYDIQRIQPTDRAAINAGRDRVIESLRAFVPARVEENDDVKVELSAGFDSRAVLGAAASTLGNDRLTAFSDGDPKSLDVSVAAKVAKRMGVRFSGGVPQDAGDEARLAYVTTLAIDTNGQANALVGMTDFIPDRWEPALPSLCGDGGEIFRGYYYPKLRRPDPRQADAGELAQTLLKKAIATQSPLQPGPADALFSRIIQRTTFITRLAPEQTDALDLLYLLERFAVWNQKLRRNRHQRSRISPFFSRAAIRAFLALPAPRGSIAQVHEELVCRFASETLSIPINREFYVGLLTGNRLQRILGRALVLRRKVMRKLSKKLARFIPARSAAANDLESVRSQRFARLLQAEGEQLLCGLQSVGPELFGRETMRQMMNRTIEGDGRHVQTLGALVTAELWLATARVVRAAAIEWMSRESATRVMPASV